MCAANTCSAPGTRWLELPTHFCVPALRVGGNSNLRQKDDSPGHRAVTSIYCLHIYQIKSPWSERGNLCSAYEYKNNGLQASRNFGTHGLWIQTRERMVCDQSHYAIERQNLGTKIWLLSANMWTFCTLLNVLGLLTSFSSIESRSAFKM